MALTSPRLASDRDGVHGARQYTRLRDALPSRLAGLLAPSLATSKYLPQAVLRARLLAVVLMTERVASAAGFSNVQIGAIAVPRLD